MGEGSPIKHLGDENMYAQYMQRLYFMQVLVA